jgi:hypothetical protein
MMDALVIKIEEVDNGFIVTYTYDKVGAPAYKHVYIAKGDMVEGVLERLDLDFPTPVPQA